MKPNPYTPPAVSLTVAVPTRQSLVATINSFLHGASTAMEFDEQLEYYYDSDDPIIKHVAESIWNHDEVYGDHFDCLTKQQWDFFQRLLLVLSSDCRIKTYSERRWSIRQLIAATALFAFAYCAVQMGWGQHLLFLAIPLGFVSIALSFWRHPDADEINPYAPAIFPFATLSDLATAYQSSGFRKTRYPKHTGVRRTGSPFIVACKEIHKYGMWIVFSPLPLLFQSFPAHHCEARVVAA